MRPTLLADVAIDTAETAAPEIVVNAVAVRQQVAFASAPSVTTAASTQASAPNASSSSDRRSMPIDHASIAEPQAAPAVDRPGGEDHPARDERQPVTSLAGAPTDLAANAPQGLTQTAGGASHGKAHAAAAGATSSAPTLTEAPQTAASPSTASMPRSMTLQLGIAHLGTVKVELLSTGRSLDVTLSADDARTVGVLQRGHDDLARALRDQNYDLTSLVVHGGDQTDNSPGERHGSAQQGSSQNTDRNGPSGSPPGRGQTGSGRREPGSPREDATARGGNGGRDRAGVLLV